jgi:outer membrane biosynthesis protein TonB
MPILDLPPNPVESALQPVKVRTGRFGELEEHELIHLLDSLDDDLSRGRFRESIYKSVLIYLAVAWFLLYGPRVLFHQPELVDPIMLMKKHDKELTYVEMPHLTSPVPKPPHPVLDKGMLQKLERETPRPPAPTPPAPVVAQTPPPPPELPHVSTPPVAQPALALPSAPRPQPALADAPTPRPAVAQNNSAHSAIQQAIDNARSGPGGSYASAPSSSTRPLQAGAEILSPTEGVDFSAYMRRLKSDIQRNWDPLIPEEVQPPLYKKGIVGIRFSIMPDGSIGQPILETRSGDVALDKAAWNAITSEGTFPPLPREFHGPKLELRLGFFYNTPITQ